MNPSHITVIKSKVFGGSAKGAEAMFKPASLGEILTFFKEASYFLATSDARMIEIRMYNKEGAEALRQMYKAQRPTQDEPETVDAFSKFYCR